MKRFNPFGNSEKNPVFGKSKLITLALLIISIVSMGCADLVLEKETIELSNPARVTVRRNYTEFSSRQVSIVVPPSYNPRDVEGETSKGDIDCRYRETFGKEVLCSLEGETEGNISVQISYITDNIAEKNRFHVFEHQKRVLEPTENYMLEVILPEGYGIISEEDGTPISPEEAKTGSEGRRIFVRWHENEIPLGDSEDFKVTYQELNVFRNVFPNNMASMIGLIILLVAVIIAVYVKYMKDEDTIASILPVLKDDEKRVVLYMLDYQGECEQTELVKNLEFSKAKISRLVKDLEERGIIKKIKEGRKNRLVIKKAIGEIEEDRV